MSDLIERQDALDALKGKLNASVKDTEAVVEYLNGVIERILQLPSAEPERKTGRWITDGKHTDHNGIEWSMMHCSVCGHKDIDSEVTRTPFCPWCGARMDGEKNE